VVKAIDHKTGREVAIKITRNTEIDHKFAVQEAKLLNQLMIEDPEDKVNIVRMYEEFFFREHHVRVSLTDFSVFRLRTPRP